FVEHAILGAADVVNLKICDIWVELSLRLKMCFHLNPRRVGINIQTTRLRYKEVGDDYPIVVRRLQEFAKAGRHADAAFIVDGMFESPPKHAPPNGLQCHPTPFFPTACRTIFGRVGAVNKKVNGIPRKEQLKGLKGVCKPDFVT